MVQIRRHYLSDLDHWGFCHKFERTRKFQSFNFRNKSALHPFYSLVSSITGVMIEKMLPTPDIDLDRGPECQKYLDEGKASIAASTPSARRTTRKWLASGRMRRLRYRVFARFA